MPGRTMGFLLGAILLGQSTPVVAQSRETAAVPIQQIDHIMIRMDYPDELYTFLTQVLQLPVAWPMATRGGVISGAVSFGNVNVETIRFPVQNGKVSRSQFVGFGFEPSGLAESLAELRRRGISYGEQRPFVVTERDGSTRTLFTNVTLTQFSDADRPADAGIHIFLSEYSPTYVNVKQRRARLRKLLAEGHGGPLGVKSVKEVVIGTTNLHTATRLWARLLAPRNPARPNLWRVGIGPAIRLVDARENTIQAIVINVGSLRHATAFLEQKGLLGPVSENEAAIDAARIHGLNIRLVEDR